MGTTEITYFICNEKTKKKSNKIDEKSGKDFTECVKRLLSSVRENQKNNIINI